MEAAGLCTCLLTDAILVAFLTDKILVMLVWMPVGGFLGRSWEHAAIGDQQMSKCARCYVLFQLSGPLSPDSKPINDFHTQPMVLKEGQG